MKTPKSSITPPFWRFASKQCSIDNYDYFRWNLHFVKTLRSDKELVEKEELLINWLEYVFCGFIQITMAIEHSLLHNDFNLGKLRTWSMFDSRNTPETANIAHDSLFHLK